MPKKVLKDPQVDPGPFTVEEIRTIIMMVESSNIARLKLQRGDQTLEIEKSQIGTSAYEISRPFSSEDLHLDFKVPTKAENNQKFEQANEVNLVIVESPLVGIFYRRPNPNAEPFVQVGQSVKEGDTLCIIEAMKIMNQVKAPTAGIIEAILIEDGQMVEYGEALFKIRKP